MLEALTRPTVSLLLAMLFLIGFACCSVQTDQAEEDDRPALRITLDPPPFTIPLGVEHVRDLVYAERPTGPLRLDLYRSTKMQTPQPVIVFIHGGGWRSGSKAEPPIVELAANGFAVVSIDYRLSDEAIFPAPLDDCRDAIKWLRTHAQEWRLDPGQIGVCGISSGGHLAALLGVAAPVDPQEAELTRVQAVADFSGPTDLLTLSSPSGDSQAAARADLFAPESLLLGALPQSSPELARTASPLHQVQPGQAYPPFFITHGHADAVVPWRQSYHFAIKLQQCGGMVRYDSYASGHPSVLLPQQVDELCLFFDEAFALRDGSDVPPAMQLTQRGTTPGSDGARHKPRRKRNAAGTVNRPAAS